MNILNDHEPYNRQIHASVVDSDMLEPRVLINLNINAGLPESVPAVVKKDRTRCDWIPIVAGDEQ